MNEIRKPFHFKNSIARIPMQENHYKKTVVRKP